MKKKKIVFIFACALMVAVLSTSMFACTEETSKTSSVVTNQELPLSDIESFIRSSADMEPTCPWSEDTKIEDKIPIYDFDNNINGYILNLTTNGKNTGYMMYDFSTGEPILAQFGYDGVYSIQGEEVTKDSELGQSKLIHVGLNDYVVQRGDDFYTIKTNTKITDQIKK